MKLEKLKILDCLSNGCRGRTYYGKAQCKACGKN